MLMAGYQTQHDSSGPPQAHRPGDLVQLRPEHSYDYHQGLPQLGDLLPIDTQLFTPSIARAFNLPTPVHFPSAFARSGLHHAQAGNSFTVHGSPQHPSGPHSHKLPGSSPQQPSARPFPATGANSGLEPSLPSTLSFRSGTYPTNLSDYGLHQHFQQHLQHYQQRGGENARSAALAAFEPGRSLLEQERMQQLAHQYATAAASYNSSAAAQPSLRSPATAYQPLNLQAAQAAMYGYSDAGSDAKAAAMAQYAGHPGFPSAPAMPNHSMNGNTPGSQGVGDKRPAEPSPQRPQPGHSGLHSGNGSDDAGLDERGARALKRPRLVWTPQLHQRFVDAVNQLGLKNAVPKTIMQLMNVDGLTRENVASHLQKYRLQLKRQPGEGPDDTGMPGNSLDGSLDLNLSLDATLGHSSIDGDGAQEGQVNAPASTEAHHRPDGTAGDPLQQPQTKTEPQNNSPAPEQQEGMAQ